MTSTIEERRAGIGRRVKERRRDNGQEGQATVPSPTISPDLAREIARETYIWGYPLVLMDLTRKVYDQLRSAHRDLGTVADEPVLACEGLPARVLPRRGSAQLRHALLRRVAGPRDRNRS